METDTMPVSKVVLGDTIVSIEGDPLIGEIIHIQHDSLGYTTVATSDDLTYIKSDTLVIVVVTEPAEDGE